MFYKICGAPKMSISTISNSYLNILNTLGAQVGYFRKKNLNWGRESRNTVQFVWKTTETNVLL